MYVYIYIYVYIYSIIIFSKEVPCGLHIDMAPMSIASRRLEIPWSSLATGKVSLVVSGIHIEARFPLRNHMSDHCCRCVKNGYNMLHPQNLPKFSPKFSPKISPNGYFNRENYIKL